MLSIRNMPKFALFVVALLGMAVVSVGVPDLAAIDDIELSTMWQQWKTAHGRNYRTRTSEEVNRRAAFVENVDRVRSWNSRAIEPGSEKLALNDFADMTHDEYVSTLMFARRPAPAEAEPNAVPTPGPLANIPTSIDYRTSGFIEPVLDQGHCGSCWAFSIAGVVSGVRAKAGLGLATFSPQQMLDCLMGPYNFGCSGGDTVSAAEYVVRYGLQHERTYPYAEVDGTCRYNRSSTGLYRPSGFVQIASRNERALAEALVAHGPVSVAINASPASIQLYGGGVIRDRTCDPNALNHAVVLVGYTSTYWILKNSWGASWGLNGYFHIARNAGNICGVATYAVAVKR